MGMLFENIKINIPEEKRKAEAALQERDTALKDLEICMHTLNMTRQGKSDEEILRSLMQKFALDEEVAKEKLTSTFEE